MKSPWKYLVEIASLGRLTKEPSLPHTIEVENPVEQSAGAMQEDSDLEARNLDVVPIGNIVFAVDQGGGASKASVDRSSTDYHAVVPEHELTPQSLPRKGRRRRSKMKATGVAVSHVVKYGEIGSAVSEPPMTFVDETLALEEEIRQLRCQLAAKLLLQNTQLKKMLERFDAS